MQELEDGTRKLHSMKYLDHLLDYMEELKGDIMVINEPGLVWSATSLIEAKAQAYQMEAIVATTELGDAYGPFCERDISSALEQTSTGSIPTWMMRNGAHGSLTQNTHVHAAVLNARMAP